MDRAEAIVLDGIVCLDGLMMCDDGGFGMNRCDGWLILAEITAGFLNRMSDVVMFD